MYIFVATYRSIMNKITFFPFLVYWLVVCPVLMKAQTPEENQKKYLYGKELYKEGRYGAAAQVFLPLTAETSYNSFSKPASYLYALSAMKDGDTESAKSMCLQLLQRYPDWDQKDEVYYLLSNIYFEQQKPRLALQFLNKVQGLRKETESLKINYLQNFNPLDTLKALQKDYPEDVCIAQVLAKRLAVMSLDEKSRMLLFFLVQEYKLDVENLFQKRPSVLKPAYNIAVLFPFQLNEIDARSGKRSNQYVLDFYEGIRMAVDSLEDKGIKANVYTYDTEKDITILNSILNLPEMASMDMIIGPVFPVQIPLVTEYCKRNSIINISPFSANSKIIENNEFSLLFQPTLELQAGAVARYASENFKYDSSYVINYTPPRHAPKHKEKELAEGKKKVIIFYGNEVKDSLLAFHHKDSCSKNGLEVVHLEKITRDRVGLLRTILGDTLKLGKCNHVFATTSDEVVAANIMSLMEISRQTTPLITRADWLDFNLIAFEQFEKRNVFFIHTDYYDFSNPVYRSFKNAWIGRTHIYPSIHSLQGYELMMYFGQALGQYGTYFKNNLDLAGFTRGVIFQGFDYTHSYSNKYVPLTRFRDKYLVLVNGK